MKQLKCLIELIRTDELCTRFIKSVCLQNNIRNFLISFLPSVMVGRSLKLPLGQQVMKWRISETILAPEVGTYGKDTREQVKLRKSLTRSEHNSTLKNITPNVRLSQWDNGADSSLHLSRVIGNKRSSINSFFCANFEKSLETEKAVSALRFAKQRRQASIPGDPLY